MLLDVFDLELAPGYLSIEVVQLLSELGDSIEESAILQAVACWLVIDPIVLLASGAAIVSHWRVALDDRCCFARAASKLSGFTAVLALHL